MSNSILELFKSVKLTKGERVIANYIINNMDEISFITSTELAKATRLSHSSIIRFTKDLGFSGFTEFQSYFRETYKRELAKKTKETHIPAEKLQLGFDKLSSSDLPEIIVDSVTNNINQVLILNTNEMFEEASKAFINSDIKYIVGYRGANSVVSFLNIILRDMVPNVFVCDSTTITTADFLVDIKSTDVLIAVTYPRYNKQTLLAIKQAKEAGAKIILFTDNITIPNIESVDYTVLAPVDSITFYNSMSAPLFSAELFSAFVSKEIGNNTKNRLNDINKYLTKTELY